MPAMVAGLREEQKDLRESQHVRELELKKLQAQVSKTTNAEAIQMMQMQRLRDIQEDSRRM
ncbi:hypothetical protein T484DRAFT_1865312, partial [Baffinella frigidus]